MQIIGTLSSRNSHSRPSKRIFATNYPTLLSDHGIRGDFRPEAIACSRRRVTAPCTL
jgi:hypothetical protein